MQPTVQQVQPVIQQVQPLSTSNSSVIIPEENYNLLREDNRRLAARLLELNNKKEELDWQLANKNNTILEYEKRIYQLAN